jgi:hypothetical protein
MMGRCFLGLLQRNHQPADVRHVRTISFITRIVVRSMSSQAVEAPR